MARPRWAWLTKHEGSDGVASWLSSVGPAPMGTLLKRPISPCSATTESVLESLYLAESVSPTPTGTPMMAALYWPTPY